MVGQVTNLSYLNTQTENAVEQIFLYHALDYRLYMAGCFVRQDAEGRKYVMCHDWDLEDNPGFDVAIYPQHFINQSTVRTRKNFRADFMFRLFHKVTRSRPAPEELKRTWGLQDNVYLNFREEEELVRLIVEIDSHDFHEKTKEQAKSDKSRDRCITADGYAIFRFTGSEIYRNVEDAVQEVDKFLRKRMVRDVRSENRYLM